MGSSIFDFIEKNLVEGMTEFDLCGQTEAFARKLGHPGLMRARGFNQEMSYLLIISGADAVMPSHNNGPLGRAGRNSCFFPMVPRTAAFPVTNR